MKRKVMLWFVVVSLIVGTTSMIYFLIEKIHHKELAHKNLEALTNFPLLDLDSTRFYLTPDRRTILIYYDSECDYCQNEIKDLSAQLDLFENMNIVLMSSEFMSAIKFYRDKNPQLQLANIQFMKINREEADRTLGSLIVPQTFIYGTDGNLIKKFIGETEIAALLQYL